jgi:hypothetical protein
VRENRRLYAEKFDLADQIIVDRYGYKRPAGGFFLWLDVSAYGGDEEVTLKLWREAGLRVIPGRYLAREQADGSNPGSSRQCNDGRGFAPPRRRAGLNMFDLRGTPVCVPSPVGRGWRTNASRVRASGLSIALTPSPQPSPHGRGRRKLPWRERPCP